VQFAARAARAGIAHHPEVVFAVAGNDVVGGQITKPAFFRFGVGGNLGVAAKVGGVEAFFWEAPTLDDEFPRPVNRFLLEVTCPDAVVCVGVAKTPVAEHLEESVMIGVEADVFEVVVFATGTDTFLSISGAAGLVRAVGLAEKNRHKLVHPGIREQQIRRVGQQAARRDDRVLFLVEEVEKRLTNLG